MPCIPTTSSLGADNQKVLENVVKRKPHIPQEWSASLQDLITRLLMKDPKKRMGYGPEDGQAVRTHAFFNDVDWLVQQHQKKRPGHPKVAE